MRFFKFTNTNYSNYKDSICKICYPEKLTDLFKIINYAKKNNKKILTIGTGLSWFDTIFNTNNIIINLKNYKKNFTLDQENGILNLSASYRIDEILKKTQKFNWSLYSIPGATNVTIGGCISNDVHGKDSFKYGNFSESIIELEVLLSNNQIIKCSKTSNKKIYKSIVGGLGLIGIILNVKLKLKKIVKIYETKHFVCSNYKEIIKVIYSNNDDYDYINGWINIYSKNDKLGNGVIFKSKKVSHQNIFINQNLNTTKFISYIQKYIFSFFVKNDLMNILNYLLFYLFKLKKKKL